MKDHTYDMCDDQLVKYLLEEATGEECRQVETWIASSTANKHYYEHFKLIWDKSRELAASSNVDEEKAWQRFQQKTAQAAVSRQGMLRNIKRTSRFLRVAAILVAVMGILTIAYFFARPTEEPRYFTLTTAAATRMDTLVDGSIITLNKNSSLTYPDQFTRDTRTVTLTGEAFFTITPNKKKPFIINVNGISVKVVGTSFNIKTKGTGTAIIVETGIVEVTNIRQTITLHPGEMVNLAAPDSLLKKQTTPDQLYRYFRNREFVCDNTPLWKLVQVLNEAYEVNIVIENKALVAMPITTTFRDQPLDSVLAIIAQTLDITVIHESDRILLK